MFTPSLEWSRTACVSQPLLGLDQIVGKLDFQAVDRHEGGSAYGILTVLVCQKCQIDSRGRRRPPTLHISDTPCCFRVDPSMRRFYLRVHRLSAISVVPILIRCMKLSSSRIFPVRGYSVDNSSGSEIHSASCQRWRVNILFSFRV